MTASHRNWTDEQDALAYDTFKTLADHKGVVYAQTMMGRIQDMGATFLDLDVDAWVARYQDETA